MAKTFIPTKEVELKGAYDEWLARIICFAFSVSPQAFVDHMNRATASTAQDTALAEGLAPIQSWVKQLLDEIITAEFDAPDLEFQWQDERESDPEKTASVNQLYVTNGIKTINEARQDIGLDPIEGGDVPMIFTPAGPVALSKLGESEAAAKGTSVPLTKFNPNHKPAGSPDGGQFTSADGGAGSGAGTGSVKPAQELILPGELPPWLFARPPVGPRGPIVPPRAPTPVPESAAPKPGAPVVPEPAPWQRLPILERPFKVRIPRLSDKEGAKNAPDWVMKDYGPPRAGEKGTSFARRILDDKYGPGKWKTGGKTEYN